MFKSASTASFAGFLLLALLIAVGVVPGLAWGQVPNVGDLTATEIRPVFSPDGTKLASASPDGLITVFDLRSGRDLAPVGQPLESVSALAFSPDGQVIASARDNTISVSSSEDGTELAFFEAQPGRTITRLVFSPRGDLLAAIFDDVEIGVWDLRAETIGAILTRPAGTLTEIAFSPDGRLLAGFGSGSGISIWDLEGQRETRTLSSPAGAPITALAFRPVGETLAVADEDANVILWDLGTGDRSVLVAHGDLIKRLLFSPDGSILASEGSDARLMLWEAASGWDRAEIPARSDALVTGLAFSADGATLASVGESGEILLWDVASGGLVQVLPGQTGVVQELAFGDADETLASISADGALIVWDLATGTERFSLQTPGSLAAGDGVSSSADAAAVNVSDASVVATKTNQTTAAGATPAQGPALAPATPGTASPGITSLAVSTEGSFIASASRDGSIHVFGSTGNELKAFRGAQGAAVSSLVFSPDGNSLFSGGRDSVIRRFTRAEGTILRDHKALEQPVRAVALSSDGLFLAAGGDETRVGVWNSDTGKLLRLLPRYTGDCDNNKCHKNFVNALAFAPDRLQLASGDEDGRIVGWDRNGRRVATLLGHAGAITALAYSSDGRMLASGSSDATVKLWNPRTGAQLHSFQHQFAINAIAISADNRYLAAAGESTQIFVWDLENIASSPLRTLSSSSSRVNALAYLPNGRLLVGTEDGTLTAWDVANGTTIKTITPTALPQTGSLLNMPSTSSPEGVELARLGVEGIATPAAERRFGDLLRSLAGNLLEWLVPSAHADPNQGPGGPILVLDSASSLFGKYYAEILRTEGFNAFSVADIGTVDATVLAAYQVVLLAEMPLTAGQATLLSDWVNAGGNLIAMRPDAQLAGLLGLTATLQTLSEGYIGVDTSAAPGNGIVGQTVQFHGTADRYTLDGATAVATLYSDAATVTTNPAVTLRDVGTNGGQAAAFTYDLATSIVFTRQGNPAWANQERDGFAPQRSDDKYFGDAAGDPQPDWVDLNKVAIPQADEQQRLLANLIVHMTRDQTPLPRFWYFPRGEKAVVIMTGDDHANNGTAPAFDYFLAASEPGCSVADWECVRGTSYMYDYTPLTDAQAAAYEAQGFEIGLHVTTNCADFTETQLDTYYDQQLDEFANRWPSAPAPTTQRHHCIAWTGWATGAKVQFNYGVRLDTDYYFWPAGWVQDRPGFLTGSGMPMRFADLDGTLIDVYQVASQMTDESGQSYPFTIDTLLDRALGAEGYYGAYTINAHTDAPYPIPEAIAVVASAQARDVPIITSRQMLEWLDARNGSSFDSIAWDGATATLSFKVTPGAGANGLQALVPLYTDAGVVTGITLNGTNSPFDSVSRAGVDYASFSAAGGDYEVTYGDDLSAPMVTSVSPADGAVDGGLGTQVSATFSEAMNPATISASTFLLRDAANVPVAASVSYNAEARTAVLRPSDPLAPETTYTAILADAGPTDVVGNGLAGEFVWTFTTEPPLNCPCTVWTDSDVPEIASSSDPNAIELGVKFRSDMDGFITGVRFYKGIGNTGTHVGNLWGEDGTPLATAIFTNETASGWQQVDFATPVPINAGTVYVASYHAPNGGYAVNAAYFVASVADSAPLYVLSDSEAAGNGVYRYGSGGFPNQSFDASNYWVDVVFSDTGTDPGDDTTPPVVTATAPSDGATNVAIGTAVTATFSEALAPATITTATFELSDGISAVPAAVNYDGAANTATLTPVDALSADTTYTATIYRRPRRCRRRCGQSLTSNVVWSFTTAAEGVGPCASPCSLWDANTTPGLLAASDTNAVELGVKFSSDIGGFITGVRFYKSAQNTGTHVGNLWAEDGTLLATAIFTNETASGWQQADFATPVAIQANTRYVASYHTQVGRYSADSGYFASAYINGPLSAPASGDSAGNGVYLYGSGGFPSNTWQSGNYWVDVVFTTETGPDTTAPVVTATAPSDGATNVAIGTVVTATFSEALAPTTITTATFELSDGFNVVPAAVAYDEAANTATLTPVDALSADTTYTATVIGGTDGVEDVAGNGLTSNVVWSFTTAVEGIGPCPTPCSLWDDTTTPTILAAADTNAVELGVKFRSDVDGFVTGIRFYKGAQNTGTHMGSLWNASGQLLAQATFTNESASGWQQVDFDTPVALQADTLYVASYHTEVGRYSIDTGYFASAYGNGPLTAPADGADGGNGVYRYGPGGFPSNSWNSGNYWVDVVFTTNTGPDTSAPTVTGTLPPDGAIDVGLATTLTATFSEPMAALTIDEATVTLTDGGSALVDATVEFRCVDAHGHADTQRTAGAEHALYGHRRGRRRWCHGFCRQSSPIRPVLEFHDGRH